MNWITCETCGCKYRLSTLAGEKIDEDAECPALAFGNQKFTIMQSPTETQRLWGERWLEHHPGELK